MEFQVVARCLDAVYCSLSLVQAGTSRRCASWHRSLAGVFDLSRVLCPFAAGEA